MASSNNAVPHCINVTSTSNRIEFLDSVSFVKLNSVNGDFFMILRLVKGSGFQIENKEKTHKYILCDLIK